MKKYILTTTLATLSIGIGSAQSVVDAVRYGNSDIIGTARYRAMGGAFGALGGDPTCSSDNPAGLAIYRGNSVFSFTPHLAFTGVTSQGTEKISTDDNNFALSNLSVLFSFKTPSNDHLVNFNLGLGVNRRMEVFSTFDSWNSNPSGSFGHYLINQAIDGFNVSSRQGPILSELAWKSNTILQKITDGKSELVNAQEEFCKNYDYDYVAEQGLWSSEKTRLDYYSISGSFNIDDCFYIGATINIADYNSTVESVFDEFYAYNEDFNSDEYLAYDNRFETKGSGIGFNLGVIWSPLDNLRLGAAIHTPEWTTITEIYEGSMLYNGSSPDGGFYMERETFEDLVYNHQTPQYNVDLVDWKSYNDEWRYEFSTPWEYQFSAAYIFGSKGLLSLEYDLRDFSTMRYSKSSFGHADDGLFADMKQHVKNYCDMQHTIKVGGEYRVTDQLSLRAGYAHKTSPFKEVAYNGNVPRADQSLTYYGPTKPNYQTVGAQTNISGGAGWRAKRWSFDLSYVYQTQKQNAAAYPGDFASSDILKLDFSQHNWDLTLSYRF